MLDAYTTAALIILGSVAVAAAIAKAVNNALHAWADESAAQAELIRRTTRPVLYLVVVLSSKYTSQQYIENASVVSIVDTAAAVAIAFLTAYIVSQLAKLAIRRHVQGDIIGDHAPEFLGKVVSILIFTPAILIVLAKLNIEITPILATLGVGSLAVGLALQGTLGNFFAGLRLISEKPIKVGDYVELLEADVEGFIEDIGWSTTRVRTIRDNIIVVPNQRFVDSNLFNSSLPSPESTVLLETGVSYDEDLEHVEQVCEEVISFVQSENPHAIETEEAWVRFSAFDDSNITVKLGFRVTSYDQRYGVIHHAIKALKHRFDDEGIEISWPIRKVYDMNDTDTV